MDIHLAPAIDHLADSNEIAQLGALLRFGHGGISAGWTVTRRRPGLHEADREGTATLRDLPPNDELDGLP